MIGEGQEIGIKLVWSDRYALLNPPLLLASDKCLQVEGR